MATTFLAVCAGWVFFRATTFEGAALVFKRLASWRSGLWPNVDLTSFWWLAALTLICHGIGRAGLWPTLVRRLPAPVLGGGYAAVLTLALLLTPDGSNKVFIYFQF